MKALHKRKSLVVLVTLICSIMFTTSVFGAATVFQPGLGKPAGEFTFNNTNLTPVKTLQGGGYADEFWINGIFRKADNYNGLVKLTLEVRRVRDNKTIYSKVFYPNSDGTGHFTTDRISVNPNEEKVQIYMDASTYNATPPGPYRSLYINYEFNLA